ncbi:MAG TPA: hypothetical protein VGS41_17620, partial [Chthonomonadales bacterium]|nr:hypothetical protein [Chthonomonadales bacterium]
HPIFRVPGLTLPELAELAALGAFFEFTYCTVSPMWLHATMAHTAAAIRSVGAGRSILSSDCGQPHNPMPHEGLRILAQMCLEHGFSETDIDRMVRRNPAAMVA